MANPKAPGKTPRKKREYASNRERFVVLGTDRTKSAIKAIDRLGNLSSPSHEYGEADVTKIMDALVAAITRTEHRLRNRTKAAEPTFSLTDGKSQA